jgi:O-antigen/teichoic acid export membrane protein
VLAAAALAFWGNLLALSVAYLAGTLVGTVGMAAGIARLGILPRAREAGPHAIGRLVRSAWAAGAHSVASMAVFRLDALLVAGLAGAAAAGQYAASYRLLETVVFVAWTVARGVFPRMAAAPGPAQLRRAIEAVLAVLATVFLPYAVLLWCRGADVLGLLYGEEFAHTGVATLAWLAPAPLLFGAGFLAGMVVLSTGPSPVLLLGSIGALVVSVALDLALIPVWGPAGAALATSVSYGVQALLLYPAVVRRAGHPALLGPMLPAAGGAVLAAAALLLPLPLAQAGPLAAAAYAAGWLLLGRWFDPAQASVLRGLVRPGSGLAPVAPRHAR